MKRYVMAISGASGPVFGVRVLRELVRSAEVHLIVSSTAFSILKEETGLDWQAATDRGTEGRVRKYLSSRRLYYWSEGNLNAPVSSGSFRADGMLIVPCSMKTLSAVASGYANTLIERAADVTLKEGRPLLIAPREMPFGAVHLENMLRLARLGVKVAPPVPAFYHRPESLEDMVDFIAGKLLDSMGIENALFRRWGVQ